MADPIGNIPQYVTSPYTQGMAPNHNYNTMGNNYANPMMNMQHPGTTYATMPQNHGAYTTMPQTFVQQPAIITQNCGAYNTTVPQNITTNTKFTADFCRETAGKDDDF